MIAFFPVLETIECNIRTIDNKNICKIQSNCKLLTHKPKISDVLNLSILSFDNKGLPTDVIDYMTSAICPSFYIIFVQNLPRVVICNNLNVLRTIKNVGTLCVSFSERSFECIRQGYFAIIGTNFGMFPYCFKSFICTLFLEVDWHIKPMCALCSILKR